MTTDAELATTEESLAATLSTGLRHLAQFIEANPKLAYMFRYTLAQAGLNAHPRQYDADFDMAAQLAVIARATLRAGGTVDKDINESWHNLNLAFSGVKVKALAYRDEVCERVQVGTKSVTRTVPDPSVEVPMVTVTEDEPVYVWECKPILAMAAKAERVAPQQIEA